MAEGQDFAHDTLYRALNQPLASFFELSLELCKAMGGLDRGYLILDDVLIQRYRSGKLGLKKARDTSTGAWGSCQDVCVRVCVRGAYRS
jgi:putative transposase